MNKKLRIKTEHEQEVSNLVERDSLTHLYNKRSVHVCIEDYLAGEGSGGQHALYIIDLDNFKAVNDHFGHPFGDAVLNEIAERITHIFRTSDIIGRIGGDEFLVFSKNIQDETIHQKARQLVERLRNTYTAGKTSLSISGSVGICCFPADGKTYASLYENADTALGSVKKERKSAYCIFNSEKHAAKIPGLVLARENDFDTGHMENQKSFNENLADYVFKILYESKKSDEGIALVLALIGKRYKADRAYVFFDSPDGRCCSNTHEWCADGIIPQIDELQNIPYEKLGSYKQNFTANGIFYCRDIKILHPDVYDVLLQQDVLSLVQCAIIDSNVFRGFIGFDYCNQKIAEDTECVETLLTISRILGVFLLKTYLRYEFDYMSAIQETMITESGSSAYIVNLKTKQVLYADKNLQKRVEQCDLGTPCYTTLYGENEQCAWCPLKTTEKNKKTHAQHSRVEQADSSITAKKIVWHADEEAYLICRVPMLYTKSEEALYEKT